MKGFVKSILNKVATRSVESKSFKSRQGELVVLMYHGIVEQQPSVPDWCLVEVDNFEAQLVELKRHFNVLSLSDAIEGLTNGTIEGPTAAITFDDGYRNNHDLAWPILERHNIPATIFITTELIDSDNTIWTARLQNAFCQTELKELSWNEETYDLSNSSSKVSALSKIKSLLKREDYQSIIRETDLIERTLIANLSSPEKIIYDYQMLSAQMVKEMSDSNLIEFGAHTLHHPILSRLNKENQMIEISQSIDEVETLTGKPCPLFAYPNGSAEDYSPITVDILNQLDVKAALTTKPGVNTKSTPRLEMVRYGVGYKADFIRELISMYK